MDDEEILKCVAEALGLRSEGGTLTPLPGKQGLLICRVSYPGAPPCIFKAVRESGRAEIRLSALLGRIAPCAVPEVLAACEDERRGYYWLVMRDEGRERLSDRPDASGYSRAACALARLQIEAISCLDSIREAGVREIDAPGWEEIALALLDAVDSGELGGRGDPWRLSGYLWKCSDMVADAAIVPLSLAHGDLHAGNVSLRDDGQACLLDWGSAYIGAAFLGLSELLWPAETHTGARLDLGPVRKAYLDSWVPLLGKPGRLAAAIAACDALARLSVTREALRCPDRFGPFGAAAMAGLFVESCRRWERAKSC